LKEFSPGYFYVEINIELKRNNQCEVQKTAFGFFKLVTAKKPVVARIPRTMIFMCASRTPATIAIVDEQAPGTQGGLDQKPENCGSDNDCRSGHNLFILGSL